VLQVHPDARLTIVGCTPQVDLPNCQVVGRVPVAEVSQYYRQASIFCLPTRLEPFGIVFIEALNHKLPVVATDVGAIPDFVTSGHNGYLVKPDQVEPLAQALIDLVGDPDKCRLFGERGYRIAMDRYTWDSVGARMKEAIIATTGQVSRYSNLPGRYQSDVR
jgi:glycosyltransferase involved in cell wall biosynthesis